MSIRHGFCYDPELDVADEFVVPAVWPHAVPDAGGSRRCPGCGLRFGSMPMKVEPGFVESVLAWALNVFPTRWTFPC